MRLALAILFGLLAAAPAGAEVAAPPACPFANQAPKLLVRLYFGQSIHGVGLVSRRAWQRFVAEEVTAALPRGFTVLDAYGQFAEPGGGGIGREQTEVVEVAADDSPEFRGRVAALADAYRRRFSQGVVGIVSQTVCGVF